MPLSHLEHFLVQADDIEATKDWYVNVLGFHVGDSPNFKFPVYWLYLGDRDIVHITEGGSKVSVNRLKYLGQQSQATQGSGVVDHIAFRCSGLKEMIDRFNTLGVEFKQRQVDEEALYQLFLFDPNSIKIELNFPASEAADLKAEIVAAELD